MINTGETLGVYLTSIAEYLDENNVALHWDPEGNYNDDEIGIFIKDIPLYPDRIVSLTGYSDLTDIILPMREVLFQVRCRGSQVPANVDEIADGILQLLHRQHHLVWKGLEITRIRHISMATLGPDESSRWERTDNYELITQRREQ